MMGRDASMVTESRMAAGRRGIREPEPGDAVPVDGVAAAEGLHEPGETRAGSCLRRALVSSILLALTGRVYTVSRRPAGGWDVQIGC